MTDNIQYSIFDGPLQVLVNENTRSDDWVNATKWCQYFGKEWNDISKQPSFKQFITTLVKTLFQGTTDKKSVVNSVNKGRAGSETWVHPLVAIKLAEWLSPEFDVFVKQTFKRYLEADITLADDILQRNKSEKDIKWLHQRAEGKIARRAFTDGLKEHGVTKEGYAMNTNAIYTSLFGMTAQELKESRQVPQKDTARDDMSLLELAAVNLAELSALERIKRTGANGNRPTSEQSRIASSRVKDAIADVM